MFPISKDKLSIGEISDYWSREIQPKTSQLEIRGLLEGAWWRGEIIGDAQVSRLQQLKNMFKFKGRKDVRIVFVVDQEASAPQITELPGGGAEVDIRPRVCVPSSRTDLWTVDSCAAAFQNLAETTSVGDFPLIAPALSAINVTRDEFLGWIASRGYRVPTFWKGHHCDVDPTIPAVQPRSQHPNGVTRVEQPIGAKTRGIVEAIEKIWPAGIPGGITAKSRDRQIVEWLEGHGCSVPSARTIQRVLKGQYRK
jgi:hypothetical protein